MILEPDDGVIKYKLSLKKTHSLSADEYVDVEKWRAILFRMGLVGEYPNTNIGYGNLSKKISGSDNQFIITGSQTGRFPHLSGKQYTRVLKCSPDKATIEAQGPIALSSEAMTHYSVYRSCPQINYVFHIHHLPLWEYLCNCPGKFTPLTIAYGTSEMAQAVEELVSQNTSGIIAMGGHHEGVVAWGENSEQAGKLILDTLKKIPKMP